MRKRRLMIMCLIASFFMNLISVQALELEQQLSNVYTVKKGDTLPNIANTFDTTVAELKTFNGLQSNSLLEGQKLFVPTTYKVEIGDELQEIAMTFNTTIDKLKLDNKLSSNKIYPGQILTIRPKPLKIEGQHILMTKEEFKDWLFNHKFSRKIRLIQQHHTWIPGYERFNRSNHFELLKGMENYHVNKMGWKTIAQHITTFPDGKIAVSRSFHLDPDGTIGPNANANALTIENVGNFDKGQDVMTKEQRDTIVFMTALLCLKFELTPSIDTITYHHWWNLKTGERVLDKGAFHEVKSCPGTNFFGGNSTTSAQKYFYPLVSQKMKEILETK